MNIYPAAGLLTAWQSAKKNGPGIKLFGAGSHPYREFEREAVF